MQTRQLGGTGLRTSALGLGCMGFSQGYGPAADGESVRAVQHAVELGVTLLDTAMSYGSGHNERLVGEALRTITAPVQVATKFGIVRSGPGVGLDGRPEHVRGYCDESLARLGVDTIDLYYLHRVDPAVPVAETVGAMAELVTAGKVRHLGLSEVTPEQMMAAASVHAIAAVQFEWSLLWRQPEADVVPAARRLGIGVVPYSPLGRGLLTAALTVENVGTSDFRRTDPRFQAGNVERNLAQVARLREVATALGRTPAQLALGWLLAQGDDVVPIPGSRDARRIEENVAAVALSPDELARVDAVLAGAEWAGDRRSFAAPVTSRVNG